MEHALYGPSGFYVRGAGPQAHFRTSVTSGPLFAAALQRLVSDVDDALARPAALRVVDVGAGDGSLLTAVLAGLDVDQRRRWQLTGVDLRGRPASLPPEIGWVREPPTGVDGVVVAHELLDNVPLDVVEQTEAGLRLVVVDELGQESLGGPLTNDDADWLRRWWPMEDADVGDRAEVGHPRDAAWAALVTSLRRGTAVAVDYAHTRAQRAAGSWASGSLTAYRAGHQVAPVPDGSCDLTAHVALDACEDAGIRAGATDSVTLAQFLALPALGVSGRRPPLDLAHSDPVGYVAALSRASQAAELTQRGGLGDFTWLVQTRGQPVAVRLTDILNAEERATPPSPQPRRPAP